MNSVEILHQNLKNNLFPTVITLKNAVDIGDIKDIIQNFAIEPRILSLTSKSKTF